MPGRQWCSGLFSFWHFAPASGEFVPAPGNLSERGFSRRVCSCRCSLLTMLGGGEALLNSVGVLHGRHPCRTPAGVDISCGTMINCSRDEGGPDRTVSVPRRGILRKGLYVVPCVGAGGSKRQSLGATTKELA